jgi:hypothetical protein
VLSVCSNNKATFGHIALQLCLLMQLCVTLLFIFVISVSARREDLDNFTLASRKSTHAACPI